MNRCFCMGRQGDDPYCPCEMRARGLIPSTEWTKEELYKLDRVLENLPMKETIYICVFNFRNATVRVESDKGIDAFQCGFWINSDMEYTVGSDCKYWIPPHAIKFIEKEVRSVL